MAQKAQAPAKKTVKKTVSYRKAVFHNVEEPKTLEQLLSQAVSVLPAFAERREPTDTLSSELRFISDYGSFKPAGFYGRLTTIQKGKYPVALKEDAHATTVPLTAFRPPAGQDYCPALCHFFVVDNHVVMSQSLLLRSSALEAHLSWLLRDSRVSLLADEEGIALSDEPKKATKARIRQSHVESMQLGRPVLDTQIVTEGRRKIKRFKSASDSVVLQFLRGLVGTQQFDKLNLADGIFRSNLEMWIELRYPKRSRSQSNEAKHLLDELALMLRDVDEDHVQIKLADGSTVTGKDLKISTPIEVAQVGDGGQILESELYSEMRNTLLGWIQSGAVSPD